MGLQCPPQTAACQVERIATWVLRGSAFLPTGQGLVSSSALLSAYEALGSSGVYILSAFFNGGPLRPLYLPMCLHLPVACWRHLACSLAKSKSEDLLQALPVSALSSLLVISPVQSPRHEPPSRLHSRHFVSNRSYILMFCVLSLSLTALPSPCTMSSITPSHCDAVSKVLINFWCSPVPLLPIPKRN